MKKKVLFLFVFATIANSIFAANWFVKGDGNANTTGGTTWATAVTMTKAASSAAASDVIYVAAGTYTQTANVTLGKAYTVIGGFAGTEDEASITTAMSNPTTNITKFTQAAASTFRIFNLGAVQTGTVTLQGITFDGLNNNQNGQAIECPSSSTLNAVIQNCKFTNFAATATGVAGAININNITANATIKDCWFENITSGNNGGVMSTNTKTGYTISVSGCIFKSTTAPSVSTNYSGGAIYANGSSTNAYTLNIDNCTFNGTKAGAGGAIYAGTFITVNITNSTFKNCKTANATAGSGHGGAIIFSSPNLTIYNCKFDSCSDNGRGLIYWNAASTRSTIKKSIFTNNTSGGTTQNSGAVFGVQNATSNVTIDSCYAYNNTSSAHATNGSASVLYSAAGKSNITIKNSAFVGNVGRSLVTRAITYAAGTTTADTITIQNSIVSNNTNTALNDTLRDVAQFSRTYNKISYTDIIANGEFLATGINFPLPGSLAYLKTIYTNLLNSGDMATLTSVSTINDIVAASNALLAKYNPATAIIVASGSNVKTYSSNGVLHLSNLELGSKVSVYSANGQLLNSSVATSSTMTFAAKGFVVVKVNSAKSSEVVKALVK
ncbi:MAG: hypothetical protein ACOYOT_11680 [Bacteroidales bacterium]